MSFNINNLSKLTSSTQLEHSPLNQLNQHQLIGITDPDECNNIVRSTKKMYSQQGLTLLEIMVVIVILGILAALIVPNLMGNTEKANHQKAVSDITTLEGALDMYKLDNQRYPTTEQGLQALVQKPTVEPLPRNYREDGYIRRLPNDPWGNEYQIRSPGDHGKIDVYSFGPDGEPETEDDVGNWSLNEK